MEPESWPGEDPSIAFDWLDGLLASPDARTVVAAVLLSDAEALRASIPDSRMERILAECDGIAREVGLVVDGVEWR